MDGFNEKSTEQVQEQQPLGCLRRFSKTIKVIIIGGLIILLMIPMFMIEDLISERGRTQEEAINEVSEKWSLAQTITGPYLNIQYPVTTENNGEKKVSIKDLFLFPDELLVNGQLKTEILKRSIYEVNVYQSELTLKGLFSPEELIKSRVDMEQLQFDRAAICLNLTDMRGISEQISITLGDSVYVFEPGMDNRGIGATGVHAITDLSDLKKNKKLPYEIKIKLKGSQSINFIPLGKTTRVDLKANWNTPSFTGSLLNKVNIKIIMSLSSILAGGGYMLYGLANNILSFYLIGVIVAIGMCGLTTIPISRILRTPVSASTSKYR